MKETIELENLMRKYRYGKEMLETELKILIDEFSATHGYNPVEHTKSRIKDNKSILAKLERKGLEPTPENIEKNVSDIIGVRLVCSFITDVYDLVSMISKSGNIIVRDKKDYISNPKKTGYSSYHLIVCVPVYLNKKEYVRAEIQIRTVAMDFWASLDHKIQYKFEGDIPDEITDKLYQYSKTIKELDNQMMNLNDLMKKYKKEL